jgi:hypothetical protein
MEYGFKITDTAIPQRHGYEQAIYCDLRISGEGYTINGEIKAVHNGEIITDIKGVVFQFTADETTRQELNAAMCDCSKTVIENVTALVSQHILDILSRGDL